MHFFSTRNDGVASGKHENTDWRLGKGNVHFTYQDKAPNPQELQAALANIQAIVESKTGTKNEPAKQVILQSQYGKGISIVDESLLKNDGLDHDPEGRLIIKGDGLFTMQDDILLLNKSGDAHAIIFKSPKAVGIVVGSWHCVEKGILPHMMSLFLAEKINPDEIEIHVGPGLGNTSYDLGEVAYKAIVNENAEYEQAFKAKAKKENKEQKYILDFGKLVSIFASFYGIKAVKTEASINTFDREAYYTAKHKAKESKDPDMLMDFYQKQLCFSARLYSKTDKQIRKICEATGKSLPKGLQEPKADYNGTGRNLNCVMLKKK